MISNLRKPVSSNQKAEDERLFSGIWIRWNTLNAAERLVCANIVLLPVWWFVGLVEYMPLFLLVGIALYEWLRYGRLRLKRPSLVVIALFAFYAYYFVDEFLIFLDANPSVELLPGDARSINLNKLIKTAFDFSIPYLVWYIQSNNVRVRLEVVAWACSVSVVQMLLLWPFIHFFFPGAATNPPRSLYALLTNKSADYLTGSGSTNYLQFYDDEGRFLFFFSNSQPAAAFLGLVGLLALDIRNRFWSLLLFVASLFLMNLAVTRSVWVAFPAVVFIRFLFVSGRFGGAWFLFALLAMFSFGTLSLPPVSDLIFNTSANTAKAVGDVRAGSTEARTQVYKQTLKEIPDKLLFGHKVEGEPVLTTVGTGQGPRVGSHSFTVGRLLYQGGLVGTGIFVTFWVSLIAWFYNTRASRPLCCISVMLLFSLMANVSFLHWMLIMGTLLCIVIRKPAIKSFNRNAF